MKRYVSDKDSFLDWKKNLLNLRFFSNSLFTNLDQGSKVIIFEAILTTFKGSVIFKGHYGSRKNCLERKIEPPKANLACQNH